MLDHGSSPRLQSAPTLSVAIVTRNRSDELGKTLAALSDAKRFFLEIIVSDDSDSESARAANRDLVHAAGAHWQAGPRRGLAANRNAAVTACRGTHIRTVDDDHAFPPGHWEICQRAIALLPETVWVIGEVKGTSPRISGVFCPGQLHPRGFAVLPADPQNSWSIADGATIYPREVFDAGHRFDESFTFGKAYLEFGSRLHHYGYRMRNLDTTFVFHLQDAAARSSSGPAADLASALAAGMCHSFLYQPTLRNKLLTTAEVIRRACVGGAEGRKAAVMALGAYRRRRRSAWRKA